MNRDALSAAVGRIAWGYVFLYLDFNLGTVDVLPDWLFFLLTVRALPALAEAVPAAALLERLGILLGAWHALAWVLEMFRITPPYLLLILVSVLCLYFHFQLLTNLAELAEKAGCTRGRSLLVLRTVLTLLTTVLALPVDWMALPAAGWIADAGLTPGILLAAGYFILILFLCGCLFILRRELEPAGGAP